MYLVNGGSQKTLQMSFTPPVLLFSARRAEASHASCSPVPDLTTRAGGRRATQARGARCAEPGACGAAQRRRARAEGAERAGGGASRGRGERSGPARTSESPPRTLRDLRPSASGRRPRPPPPPAERRARAEDGGSMDFLMESGFMHWMSERMSVTNWVKADFHETSRITLKFAAPPREISARRGEFALRQLLFLG